MYSSNQIGADKLGSFSAFGTPYGACQAPCTAPGGFVGNTTLLPQNKMSMTSRPRRQTNLLALFICLLLPCSVFASVFALESFSMHYTQPGTTRFLVILVGIVVAMIGALVLCLWCFPGRWPLDPKWYTFLFATAALAWILGYIYGNQNFNENTAMYNDAQSLNSYKDLNPSTTKGNMVMDAGQMEFSQGSYIDTTKSMGFKDADTYCVAPIVCCEDNGAHSNSVGSNVSAAVASTEKPLEYDFWAIGINCCSAQFPDFHCGAFSNPSVRSGLRLIADDKKAYFRLAMMQAEAAFNMKARHPVFVFWLQDPAREVNLYGEAAAKFYVTVLSLFIVWQLLAVIFVTVLFSKFSP